MTPAAPAPTPYGGTPLQGLALLDAYADLRWSDLSEGDPFAQGDAAAPWAGALETAAQDWDLLDGPAAHEDVAPAGDWSDPFAAAAGLDAATPPPPPTPRPGAGPRDAPARSAEPTPKPTPSSEPAAPAPAALALERRLAPAAPAPERWAAPAAPADAVGDTAPTDIPSVGAAGERSPAPAAPASPARDARPDPARTESASLPPVEAPPASEPPAPALRQPSAIGRPAVGGVADASFPAVAREDVAPETSPPFEDGATASPERPTPSADAPRRPAPPLADGTAGRPSLQMAEAVHDASTQAPGVQLPPSAPKPASEPDHHPRTAASVAPSGAGDAIQQVGLAPPPARMSAATEETARLPPPRSRTGPSPSSTQAPGLAPSVPTSPDLAPLRPRPADAALGEMTGERGQAAASQALQEGTAAPTPSPAAPRSPAAPPSEAPVGDDRRSTGAHEGGGRVSNERFVAHAQPPSPQPTSRAWDGREEEPGPADGASGGERKGGPTEERTRSARSVAKIEPGEEATGGFARLGTGRARSAAQPSAPPHASPAADEAERPASPSHEVPPREPGVGGASGFAVPAADGVGSATPVEPPQGASPPLATERRARDAPLDRGEDGPADLSPSGPGSHPVAQVRAAAVVRETAVGTREAPSPPARSPPPVGSAPAPAPASALVEARGGRGVFSAAPGRSERSSPSLTGAQVAPIPQPASTPHRDESGRVAGSEPFESSEPPRSSQREPVRGDAADGYSRPPRERSASTATADRKAWSMSERPATTTGDFPASPAGASWPAARPPFPKTGVSPARSSTRPSPLAPRGEAASHPTPTRIPSGRLPRAVVPEEAGETRPSSRSGASPSGEDAEAAAGTPQARGATGAPQAHPPRREPPPSNPSASGPAPGADRRPAHAAPARGADTGVREPRGAAASPAAVAGRRRMAPSEPEPVTVTIGRITIADEARDRGPRRPSRASAAVSLADYLSRRR